MEEPLDPTAAPKKKKNKVRSAWISFGGRIVAQIIGAAASVALALFFLQRSGPAEDTRSAVTTPPPVPVQSARPAGEIAVAVLPLSNFSPSADQDYFADGMTEALTAELAQIEGLHVISRTSVMQYKSTVKSVPQVARELNVDFVVEGSVMRDKERVRITAQLINAQTDVHIWAKSYDRTIRDILSLQAAVAAEIAGELKGRLSLPGRARRAVDPAVYELYLRGRYAWARQTPEGFDAALKYFTEATARDPEFALAYAGLADAFSLYPTASLVNRSVDNLSRARAAAERAIALDDSLAEAHTSLAAVHFFGEHNFDAAAREFERAIQLNGHYPTAHQWYAIALSENGRQAEAVQHAERAVRQDPLSGSTHQALGLVHYYARDYAKAEAASRKAIELNAHLPLARVVLAKTLMLEGKPQEAAAVCEAAPDAQNTDILLARGIAYTRAGNQAAADAILKELTRRPRHTAVLVQWYAATGYQDAAYRVVRDSGAPLPSLLRIDPLYDHFRADPRFATAAQ